MWPSNVTNILPCMPAVSINYFCLAKNNQIGQIGLDIVLIVWFQFVSHPHCQQLLASVWYEGIPGWRRYNTITKFLLILGLILLKPGMMVYYLVKPHSSVGRIMRTPFMKFLYHSASFGVFLLLLVLVSTNVGGDARSIRQQERGPLPTKLECLIGIYVIG